MTLPTSPPDAQPPGALPVVPVERVGPAVPADALTAETPERAEPPTAEEVARLRAELAAAHTQLDTRRRRSRALLTLRRVAAAVLIAVTAFALVTSVVGLWAARTTLNTDRWVATVAPLPQDPLVSAAVAQYSTTQLFEVLNVDQRLREVLPPQAAFVVGPLTGQLQEQVRKTVVNVMQSDRFQTIWTELNRQVHQRALAILEGTSTTVVAAEDHVTIDLLPLINQVLRELSAQLPTLFGKQITLPDLSSGAIPENLRVRVQDALGVSLPANFAQFTVYDAGQLHSLQEAVVTAKRDLALFVASTIVLLVLALVVSPRRRRTVLQLGIWLVVAAIAVTAVLRGVRKQLLAEVPSGVYRDGVAAATTTIFALLRERGTQIIWIGAILAVVAYLVGPGRLPVWLRMRTRRGLRAGGRWTATAGRATAAHGPGWIAAHLDPLRIAGLVVAGVLALILSSWTALLVIVIVLAVYEIGVTLVARSVSRPDPALGAPS
jgi:hypothetical protein